MNAKHLFRLLWAALWLLLPAVSVAQTTVSGRPHLLKDDKLLIQGAQPVGQQEGLGYIDFGPTGEHTDPTTGDWERRAYTIKLLRPRGAEADYAVSIWYQKADVGSLDVDVPVEHYDDFYDRALIKPGDDYSRADGWNCIVFLPGETEKTITFYTRGYLNGTQPYARDLAAYIRFCYPNRTTIDYDLLQLRFQNDSPQRSPEQVAEADELRIAEQSYLRNGYHPKAGEWMMGTIKVAHTREFYCDSNFPLVISPDTRLRLQTGSGEQAVPSTLPEGAQVTGELTFAYRVEDEDVLPDGKGGVAAKLDFTTIDGILAPGLTTTKTARSTSTMHLNYETALQGTLRPHFGTLTTDKPVYQPMETVTARVPVLNWAQLQALYGEQWTGCISLTADGGRTTLNAQPGSLDEQTGQLVFSFSADAGVPGQLRSTAFVEVLTDGVLLPTNDTGDWWNEDRPPYLLPAGAFVSYEVEGEPVIVPTTSITIDGMPAEGSLRRDGKLQQFRLLARILPQNSSFLSGTWSSSDPQVATISQNGTVEIVRSGYTDLTFRSAEADYLLAQGATDIDLSRLTATVRLHVQEAQPADDYVYKVFTSDDEEVILTAIIRLRRHDGFAADVPLEAWEVASEEVPVTLHHHDSAAYPDLQLTATVDAQGWATVTVPWSDERFLRKRYAGASHEDEPTCTATFSVPIRNKYDGELATYTYVWDVYHGLVNAEFATHLGDTAVVVLDDQGRGHVTARVRNLDREEGFELKLYHGLLSSDGKDFEGVVDRDNYPKLTVKAGELGLFEGEKDMGRGVKLRMMPDRKYVEATIDYDFTIQKSQTNALIAHAQNVYGSYDPRQPGWNLGANERWVHDDPYVGWDVQEPFSRFTTRYHTKKSAAGDYVGYDLSGTLGSDAWAEDNKALYDAYLADPSPSNFDALIYSNIVGLQLTNAHAQWGRCELIVDGQDVVRTIQPSQRAQVFLSFPFDDAPHTFTLRWPEVGLERQRSYTAYGKELASRYDFACTVTGQYSSEVTTLQLNYTTSTGVGRTVSLTPDPVEGYQLRKTFSLVEPDGIHDLTVTDEVADGEAHRVLSPTLIPSPVSTRRASRQSLVACHDQIDDAIAETVSRQGLNDFTLSTLGTYYIKVVDALTGEAVTTARLNYSLWEKEMEPDADGVFTLHHDYLSRAMIYDTQGGYDPQFIYSSEMRQRSVLVNGVESFYDGERVVCTLALTPRTGEAPRLAVTDLQVEETHPAGGTEMVRKTYSGTATLLPYDGSKKPGRRLRMTLMARSADYDYDRQSLLSIVSPQASDRAAIALTHQKLDSGDDFITRRATEQGQAVYYTVFRVEGELRNLLAPEVTGEARLRGLYAGTDFALFQLRNLDTDPSFMLDGVSYEPEVPQVHVGEVSRGKGLGKMQKSFDGFSIELPSTLPFTLAVTHENNDWIVRGIYAHSFLPGGKVMDLVDKADFIGNVDAAFWELKRAVRGKKAEYNRDERALAWASASAGIKAWIEGKVAYDYTRDKYDFMLNGVGIAAEASAYFKGKAYFGFGSFGTSISGSVSASASLDRPSDEDLERAEAIGVASPFKMDLTFDFSTALAVSAQAELGIDLFIASAKAGIRGGASAAFQSKAIVKPYLGEVDKGLKMDLSAWLQAYATAKFLWWKKTWTGTILDKRGTWYTPDNASNPIYRDDHEDDDDAPQVRTQLRASVYKPLQMARAPRNSAILLTGIDAYAQPTYLFGGRDLAYLSPVEGDVSHETVALSSGRSLPVPQSHNVFSLSAASRTLQEQPTALMAYTYSTAQAPTTATGEELQQRARQTQVAVMTGTVESWSAPRTLSTALCNLDARAAMGTDGSAAVAWKQGEYVSQEVEGDPTAGLIDGMLVVSRQQDGAWTDPVALMATTPESQLTDYQLALIDGRPVAVGIVSSRRPDGTTRSQLATAMLSATGEPITSTTGMQAAQPQVAALSTNCYATALMPREDGSQDVRLFRITPAGTLADMGWLGLSQRPIIDYRLIAPESADGVDGLGIVWKESRRTATQADPTTSDGVLTQLYCARIAQSRDGEIYLSCPQKLIDQPSDLIVTYYDATLSGQTIAAAITLADFDTDGANVVRSTAEWANSVRCEYAQLDSRVQEGDEVQLAFQVFNEGYEAVDYLDINVGGRTTTRTVAILPGHSATVTAPAPREADLTQPLQFQITPYFSSQPLRARSLQEARQRADGMPDVGIRMRASRSGMGSVQLQVADMAVRLLSSTPTGEGTTIVAAAIDNRSPLPLQDDWTVEVGLYDDATALHPVQGCTPVQLPRSALYTTVDGTPARNSVPVTLTVPAQQAARTLYLAVRTLTAGGEEVDDQAPEDNVRPVSVFAASPTVSTVWELQGGQWQTIVLPEDMDADRIAAVWGSGTKLAKLSQTQWDYSEETGYTVRFTPVTTIERLTPMLIKPAQDGTRYVSDTPFGIDDPADNPYLRLEDTQRAQSFYMLGACAGDYNLLPGEIYLRSEAGQMRFYRADDEDCWAHLGRCYFRITDDRTGEVLRTVPVGYQIEGEPSAIHPVEMLQQRAAEATYTTDGRATRANSRGVYVQQGRKVVVQ